MVVLMKRVHLPSPIDTRVVNGALLPVAETKSKYKHTLQNVTVTSTDVSTLLRQEYLKHWFYNPAETLETSTTNMPFLTLYDMFSSKAVDLKRPDQTRNIVVIIIHIFKLTARHLVKGETRRTRVTNNVSTN